MPPSPRRQSPAVSEYHGREVIAVRDADLGPQCGTVGFAGAVGAGEVERPAVAAQRQRVDEPAESHRAGPRSIDDLVAAADDEVADLRGGTPAMFSCSPTARTPSAEPGIQPSQPGSFAPSGPRPRRAAPPARLRTTSVRSGRHGRPRRAPRAGVAIGSRAPRAVPETTEEERRDQDDHDGEAERRAST